MFYSENGIKIKTKELKQEEILEEDYESYHPYCDEHKWASWNLTPVGTKNISSIYFLCFDEDLKIRREVSSNVRWNEIEIDKISLLKETFRFFLREEFSDEKFNLFLINFGFTKNE